MNKKEAILINAATIIYEEGIQKLTMDYLASITEMTKGGILYHYESKEKLLWHMNQMAIEKFEHRWNHYQEEMSGNSLITRAYAYATLDFLNEPEFLLLPAVFISSLEYEDSQQLWKETTEKWEAAFEEDKGDKSKILKLRLICDGIWFSILYTPENSLRPQMEALVLDYCDSLEKEEN